MLKSWLFLLIIIMRTPAFGQLQDEAGFYCSNKLVLRVKPIGAVPVPVLKIKREWLQADETLLVGYKCAAKHPGWQRSFQWAVNENEVLLTKLFAKDDGEYRFALAELKDLLQKHKKLLLYTIQQPPQNGGPSGIRIRRFLVCEIIVE